ncbi:GNAT family N-acetyltransferase [Sporomusa sp.]|uniref:GNAT family N-acetyltransferase n=1 Tax=Sporomusa sp. TaxID=2078658 RepID=UPI002CAC339C|nr:GNAT family N-acetyltransferase [Sporomusa sp.]HWR42935.1 GNAT family N-acetyltransferase [Sporomusa sp.]
MLAISSMSSSDLGELAALYEELTGRKTNMVLMESLFKKITDNTDYILIGARDKEQRLVGSVMGIVCADIVGECQPFLVLENVIVSEKCRRQGIGRKLIQYIENCARERNCYYIMLVSLIKRKEAHEFYEANGYKSGVVQGYKKYL